MQRFLKEDFESPTIIGSGGYGVVYKARHRHLGNVAYKEMIRGTDMREILHARSLVSHDNIVKVHGFLFNNSEDSIPKGYVMELLDNTLHEVIHKDSNNSTLPFYSRFKAIQIFLEICKGLEALHANRTLHRDVKPGNVLVSKNLMMVKLCDFGTCSTGTLAQTTGVGTCFYMAPEVANFGGVSVSQYTDKCDVFSAAILFSELFYQRIPYETNGIAFLKGLADGCRPSLESPQLRGDIASLIKRAWHTNPRERPTIRQVREKLEEIISSCVFPFVDSYYKNKDLSQIPRSYETIDSYLHGILVDVHPDHNLLKRQVFNASARYGISLPFHESEFSHPYCRRKLIPMQYRMEHQSVLLHELRQLSKVHTDPSIISVYGLVFSSHSENPIGYVMERMDTSLEQVVGDQAPPISDMQRRAVIKGLLNALSCIHKQGIVHRDIVLKNIHVSRDIQIVKLSGFNESLPWETLDGSAEQKVKLWDQLTSQDLEMATLICREVTKKSQPSDQRT